MGHVFTYSVGELSGNPEYLVVIGTLARQLRQLPVDFVVEGLTERLHHRDAEQVRSDYLAVSGCIDQPYPFRVRSAINDVPRSVLELQKEGELANRGRPRFRTFVKGLTKSDGHFGDVSVLGAGPLLTVNDIFALTKNEIYRVSPFPEALGMYPDDRFNVPYDLSLDLDGFTAWTVNSRENFGAHITLVDRIERGCLPVSV